MRTEEFDWSDFSISGGDPELAKIRLEKPAGAVASDISGNITVTFPANMNAFLNQDKTGGPAPASYSFSALPVDIYLEGAAPSSDILDSKVKAEMTLNSGVKCHDEIWYTVIQVEIKNPTDPNKGITNDSDDYFFRGPDEPNVKVYYDFLPTDVNASSVKLLIKEGGSTLRQISLSTTKGTNLLAEWNGKDVNGVYYDDDKWDFRAVIKVVIGGLTCMSNEHPIADLLYKHRPLVYVHSNEFSGPVAAEFMMDHADLYKRKTSWPDEKLASQPLDFNDLSGPNDATNRYQNLYNSYRQSGAGTHEVYCRGTINSNYIFLHYWHFEPSSSIAEDTGVYHEGDWEMFQIAVEPNTAAKELQPIAITASQHYYGQTIRWAEIGNGPSSQDQDYVGKSGSGHRPKVCVALRSHATYFRQGYFKVATGGANHGYQYDAAPNPWPTKDDATGGSSYSYTLRIFHNSMISHWHGNWGQDGVPLLPHDDGPPSPAHREVHSSPSINMWDEPKEFNNYYRKRVSYPDGDWAHPETSIP